MFGYENNVYVFLKRENTRILSKRIPNCYNYTLADVPKCIPNCYNYTLADASKCFPNCYNYTSADASKCFPNCYTNLKKVIKFVKGIKHFIINF